MFAFISYRNLNNKLFFNWHVNITQRKIMIVIYNTFATKYSRALILNLEIKL